MRQAASSSVSDTLYPQALDDFERLFPEDPAFISRKMDQMLLKERFEDALKAVDELDRWVEGDPYLDRVRGRIHAKAGRPIERRSALQEPSSVSPSLIRRVGIDDA